MQFELEIDSEDNCDVFTREPAGMIILDLQGTIRFANAAACLLLNKREKDLVGAHQDIPACDSQTVELEIPRAFGETGIVELRYRKIRWSNQSGYLITIQDVTERFRGDDAMQN